MIRQRDVEQTGSVTAVPAKRGDRRDGLVFLKEGGPRFELEDLLRASAEVLGSGNFGASYKATPLDGNPMVVKRFKEMKGAGREDFNEHMRRLGRLSHPNLLPVVAYLYKKDEKLFVTEHMANGSLAQILHGGARSGLPQLDWAARLRIVKGVARGLAYLYEELPMLTVPHGHLKSSNILLDDHFQPLLTDYALVPVMNQSHAAQLMVAFKSPERKQFGKSSKKSDVWCLGLLILEIVTGRPPSYDVKASAQAATASPEHEQKQKPSAGNDLVGLVASTSEEEWLTTVVDGDLKYEDEADKEEAVKLIKIGMACCEGNVDSRWELKNAVDRIEELKGKERADNEDNSFYSSLSDGAERDEDFTNVAIH